MALSRSPRLIYRLLIVTWTGCSDPTAAGLVAVDADVGLGDAGSEDVGAADARPDRALERPEPDPNLISRCRARSSALVETEPFRAGDKRWEAYTEQAIDGCFLYRGFVSIVASSSVTLAERRELTERTKVSLHLFACNVCTFEQILEYPRVDRFDPEAGGFGFFLEVDELWGWAKGFGLQARDAATRATADFSCGTDWPPIASLTDFATLEAVDVDPGEVIEVIRSLPMRPSESVFDDLFIPEPHPSPDDAALDALFSVAHRWGNSDVAGVWSRCPGTWNSGSQEQPLELPLVYEPPLPPGLFSPGFGRQD